MKKTMTGIIACMLILLSCAVPITSTNTSKTTSGPLTQETTLYVGGSGPGNYSKILDAINAANDGDTVFVYHGIYYENLVVYKSIHLIGENKETTIIDGQGKADGVRLTDNNITISGFTVQHGNEVGIFMLAENITVTGNILASNGIDIWLCYSYNTITDNVLLGGGLYIPYYYGHHNIITNNVVDGKPLVYLEGVHDILITSESGQIVLLDCENIWIQDQNLQGVHYGITIGGSRYCHISTSTISRCFTGIFMFQSTDIAIVANTIDNNTAFGIHMMNSSDNRISQNTISGSMAGSGVYIEYYSIDNIISNNTLVSNGFGMHITSYGNRVSDNLILQNSQGIGLFNLSQTYSNDSARFTTIVGNTISDCGDGDGICMLGIDNCQITDNLISNSRYGIRHCSSRDAIISHNTLVNNSWQGIALEYSFDNYISENTIKQSIIGISLEASSTTDIASNDVQNCNYGMYLRQSSNVNIEYNDIAKNKEGMYLVQSDNNSILNNNFKRNERHGNFLNCTNTWDGNFWNRIRFLPYLIIGKQTVTLPFQKQIELPKIDIDRNPAPQPNVIP
jgi:parallel beta-helix repeat protein